MKPLVLPETTPEHIIAGVTPEGVVTCKVLPVTAVNNAVSPVTVAPLIRVVNTPETKFAVVPLVVVPVRVIKVPLVN